jgi:hypothetical protein
MKNQFEINTVMLLAKSTRHPPYQKFKNACLEHAKVLSALQKFQEVIFPPFPSFKII